MNTPAPAAPGTTKPIAQIVPGEVVTVATQSGIKVLDHVPASFVPLPSYDRDGQLDERWGKLIGSADHGVRSLFGGVWPSTSIMYRTTPMVAQEDGSWLVQL